MNAPVPDPIDVITAAPDDTAATLLRRTLRTERTALIELPLRKLGWDADRALGVVREFYTLASPFQREHGRSGQHLLVAAFAAGTEKEVELARLSDEEVQVFDPVRRPGEPKCAAEWLGRIHSPQVEVVADRVPASEVQPEEASVPPSDSSKRTQNQIRKLTRRATRVVLASHGERSEADVRDLVRKLVREELLAEQLATKKRLLIGRRFNGLKARGSAKKGVPPKPGGKELVR